MRKKNLKLLFLFGLGLSMTACSKKDAITSESNAAKLKTSNFNINGSFVVTNKTYYVSASTGNNGWDGTEATHTTGITGPFRTINQANSVTGAGDFVNIMPGDYYWEVSGDQVASITHSGIAGSPNTYQAYDINNKPKIHALANDGTSGTGLYKALELDANFITIKNLELVGDQTNCVTTTPLGIAKYNTNGIQLAGLGTARHDIEIDNCIIHDFPGAGIASKHADKMTINGNIVYNNAFYSEYGTSGISILDPSNSGTASNGTANGDSTHPKIIIENNLCYNNKETVTDITANPQKVTDGNGIIIDVNFVNNPYGDYLGYTTVENNICYTNGGAGINATSAQNLSIVNNTTCNNGSVVNYAEVQLYGGKNLIITNNILYARPTANGGLCYYNNKPAGTILFDYNIYYPYGTATLGANDVTANPKFAGVTGYNIPTNFGDYAPPAFFKLQSISPAVNTGTNQSGAYYSYFDFEGYYRGSQPDRGAYEYH